MSMMLETEEEAEGDALGRQTNEDNEGEYQKSEQTLDKSDNKSDTDEDHTGDAGETFQPNDLQEPDTPGGDG